MEIIVCIKQVPDVTDVKWTKENNLDRSLMLSKINQQDDWALDWALKIKSKFTTAKITVISMGPIGAKKEIERAFAKGVDRGILLCDKKFAASDTLATSKIISSAIKKYVGDFNLILTGQMAADGDTAQVPVSISQMLNIVDITNCIEIINADKSIAFVRQEFDNHIDTIEIKTPCLIAIKKECPEQNIPKIEDYVKAHSKSIEIYNFDDLGISKDEVGIFGSPTWVNKAFRPEITKTTQEIKENFADKILELVSENK